MLARATSSASGTSDDSHPLVDGSVSQPHEYREAERTLTRLLDLMHRGRLPAQLLPLLDNFHAAVSAEPAWRCHLLALSNDELGVIFDGLADPLEPSIAVAFSSTCKGLRTPLQAPLEVLKQRHTKAKALWSKTDTLESLASMRDAACLTWEERDLTADDMATLSMLLRTAGLQKLDEIAVVGSHFGDAGVQALCEGLAYSSLSNICLEDNNIGTAGAEALGATFRSGGLPDLEVLSLGGNRIGKQGVAALAEPLRKQPRLRLLDFSGCEIGDEGVAALVDNLGKDDFKALEQLWLQHCGLTDVGCATLVSALDNGGLLRTRIHGIVNRRNTNPDASEAACQAVVDAKERARARRRGRR